jgi:hypothetical protein
MLDIVEQDLLKVVYVLKYFAMFLDPFHSMLLIQKSIATMLEKMNRVMIFKEIFLSLEVNGS